MPIVFSTTMNNMNWSIGLEVTLSVLGFTDINTPTIGGMIYWANQHTAMVAGVWWWIAFPVIAVIVMIFIGLFLLAVSMNEYIDPRSRLPRIGARREPCPAAQLPRPTQHDASLSVEISGPISGPAISASIATCSAVDGDELRDPRASEIYGLAGESSSGKTTLIKTIAGAVRPPLEVVGGSGRNSLSCRGYERSHLAPAAEVGADPLAASILHHAGLHERPESGAPAASAFVDFACPHIGGSRAAISRQSVTAHLRASSSTRRCSTPTRMSCPAACASASPSRSRPSAGPISSLPTSRRPRSTSWCRRTCSA